VSFRAICVRLENNGISHETAQNRMKRAIWSSAAGKPVGSDEGRGRLVLMGFLPPALVAQRIEQKTSNLLVAGSIPAEGAS
jgi:hypothetical protein